MSFWSRIIDTINGKENPSSFSGEEQHDSSIFAYVDVEVGMRDQKNHDIGVVRYDGAVSHSADIRSTMEFAKNM